MAAPEERRAGIGSETIRVTTGGTELELRAALLAAGEDPEAGAEVLLVEVPAPSTHSASVPFPEMMPTGGVHSGGVDMVTHVSVPLGMEGALCGFEDDVMAKRLEIAIPLLRYTRMFCFTEGADSRCAGWTVTMWLG